MEEKKVSWKHALYLGLMQPPHELAKYLTEHSNSKYDDVAPIILEQGVMAGLKHVAALTDTKWDDIALDGVEKLVESILK